MIRKGKECRWCLKPGFNDRWGLAGQQEPPASPLWALASCSVAQHFDLAKRGGGIKLNQKAREMSQQDRSRALRVSSPRFPGERFVIQEFVQTSL